MERDWSQGFSKEECDRIMKRCAYLDIGLNIRISNMERIRYRIDKNYIKNVKCYNDNIIPTSDFEPVSKNLKRI